MSNKKKNTMKTLKASFFTLCLMMSSLAFSQVYDDMDTNRDGGVDQDEFNQTYSDSYDQWDANSDGTVDDREFYDTTYDRMDTNSDEYLDTNEWNEGYDNVYGEYLRTNDNTQFDSDGDQRISRDEYYTGMRDTDYYDSFDANRDSSIDTDEMNQGVYNNLDQNQDNTIDRDEYDRFGSYYLDAEY